MMGVISGVRKRLSELIGNVNRTVNLWANRIWSARPSFDWTRVDYAFYDKLWRGQAVGLEKSGLIVKPIVSKITAWVLGRAPEIIIDEDPALEQEVRDWWSENEATILRGFMESGKLGDSFILLNGDGTLSLLPPDIVHPIVDEGDYSQIIGWRVNAVYPHPETFQTMTIEDEYYADRRVRRIRLDAAIEETTFKNPLGRIPVIHIPGAAGGVNDLFGRPEAEALIELLHSYGQILDAGLDGNYRQGRPVFAMNFNSKTELDQFWDLYGKTETQTLSDGSTETNKYLDVDLEGVVTFANAQGEFKSPGSSSTDTMNYLQILYYLIIEHTELPEFLLGSAIQGSKASADAQMPPFIKFIELRQKLAEGWIKELIQLAIAYMRTVMLRRTAQDVTVKIMWDSLTDDDNRLTLDTLKWAYATGLVDDENAVRLMPVEIDDPNEMLQKLRANDGNDGDAFDDAMEDDANEPDGEMVGADGKGLYLNGGLIREQSHDGVMVAFRVPIDVGSHLGRRMRDNRIEPVEIRDMHMTLAYLGKVDEQQIDLEILQDAIEKFALGHRRLEGTVSGIGRFTASESSDLKDVMYASFDSPALSEFRQALVDAIEDAGGFVMKNHGFTPHITMAYIEPFVDTPEVYMAHEYIRFDRVTVYWGTQQIDIDLQDKLVSADLVDNPVPMVLSN